VNPCGLAGWAEETPYQGEVMQVNLVDMLLGLVGRVEMGLME
jgi:hypothetical protein